MGLSAHPARMLASSTEKGLCFRSFLASAKAAGWVRMLSWDDFRYVKAIAEARSLAGAGEHLGVNIPRCSVGSARSSSTSARACSSAAAPVMRSPPAARRWSTSPSACFRRSSASSAGSPARTCGLRGTADHRQRRPPPASPERGVRRFSPRLSADHPGHRGIESASQPDQARCRRRGAGRLSGGVRGRRAGGGSLLRHRLASESQVTQGPTPDHDARRNRGREGCEYSHVAGTEPG